MDKQLFERTYRRRVVKRNGDDALYVGDVIVLNNKYETQVIWNGGFLFHLCLSVLILGI